MLNRKESNRWLLLYLLYLMESCPNQEARLQAMVFDIQKAIREKGSTQTFNYHFIRWRLGAYSQELHADIEFLLENELIMKQGFGLSERAKKQIESTKHLLNTFFYLGEDLFSSKMEELKDMEIKSLLVHVYDKHELITQKMGKAIQHVLYDPDFYK